MNAIRGQWAVARARLVAIVPLVILAGCTERPRPLPVFNTVPDFVLTAQTGREFQKQFLDGKIWVADFIFTTCPGPCPRMTAQMRQIGAEVEDLPQVHLVSFTVDPKNDTPAVLSEYAARFRAKTDRWHFLTGPRETLHLMMRSAFMLGDVNGALTHSTRFVLVDAHGRVRGYYETTDPDQLKRLVADIRQLARSDS